MVVVIAEAQGQTGAETLGKLANVDWLRFCEQLKSVEIICMSSISKEVWSSPSFLFPISNAEVDSTRLLPAASSASVSLASSPMQFSTQSSIVSKLFPFP